MEERMEQKCNAVFTFLQDTKDGKYAEIDKHIIEVPRSLMNRNEYVFDQEMPVLFSITNQV